MEDKATTSPPSGEVSSTSDKPESPTENNTTGTTTTQQDSSFKYLGRVFGYNDGLGWLLNGIALICMIGAGVTLPLMEIIFGNFVNYLNDFVLGRSTAHEFRHQIGKHALYFIYLFVAKIVLTYAWTVLVSICAIRTTKNLRLDFLRQVLRQEISFFDTPGSSISGRITNNGNLVNNGISEKLGIVIQAASCFIAAFVVSFISQWKLTFIILAIVPVHFCVVGGSVTYDTKLEGEMFEIYKESDSLAEEVLSTVRTAHAFWAFPKLSRRFDDILDRARKIGNKKTRAYAFMFPIEIFCVLSGYGLAFWQAIRMFNNGEITKPGSVIIVIFSVLVASGALTTIGVQSIVFSKAAAAAQDLFTIIDRKSAIDSLSTDGAEIEDFSGEIKLQGLQFSYPTRPDVPVLAGIDLHFPARKTTALVGASGSGKSTIFGILERWYSPSSGAITLDGHPIESLKLQWLRTNVRLVQQEPTLFSGTICENVMHGLYGTHMASLSEEEKKKLVTEACKSAFADDFIRKLPKGYDTYIGERGATLSGGQKQRIVIARSIISNPSVLLLDEATSALDPRAEKIVQKALNNVARGRTMIVIAHRLSTIRDADNIVVMSKGQLVEQGTHQELIASNGQYAKLIQAQDLGHSFQPGGSNDDNVQDKNQDQEQDLDLELVSTGHSDVSSPADEVSGKEVDTIGLFRGMYMVFKEQPSLWFLLAISFPTCMATGASYPALAILFSKTITAFQEHDKHRVDFLALMFFIVAIGQAVVYSLVALISNTFAQQVMRYYRSDMFNSILRQDMSFFDRPGISTGALVSRLASESTSLQDLVSRNLVTTLHNMISVLASCILAICFGWKLGLVLTFGALPALVGSGYLRIKLEQRLNADTEARFAESSGLAAEAAMSVRTVSSLALEHAFIDRYDRALSSLAREAIGTLGLKMLFYSASQSITFLAMGLAFWYGGHLVSRGEYDLTQFYVVVIATIFSGEAAASFFQFTSSFTKARTAINYIFRLRESRALSGHDCGDGSQGRGEERGVDLQADQVTFAYPLRPARQVLKGISFDAGSGKMVALVGASGCGKSTIVSLLERFYDVTTGEIRIDGVDIRTHDRRLHRRSIALVQQEPILYQGSIRDNIALGIEDKDPSDDDIIEACKQANIWSFISSLPEGLATPCGGQGLSLSGGQRQRIAIARALIRKPRLLLLDEATSALDTESEKVVKEALEQAAAAAGRTTVVVAHRLSTVRDADVIVVLDQGKIAEVGKHDELIGKRGIYYELALGQSLDKEA